MTPEEKVELLKLDPTIGRRQAEKLRALRANRDGAKAEALLARLETAARGTENLIPLFVDCVEARVTLGEISHRLRTVWGEYQPQVVI